MSTIQTYFDKLLIRIDGLLGVSLSDRESVVIFKASKSGDVDQLLESSALTSGFLIASDQAGKLGLKRNKSILTCTGQYQLAQFSFPAFVVTLLADHTANAGILLDLEEELGTLTEEMYLALSQA